MWMAFQATELCESQSGQESEAAKDQVLALQCPWRGNGGGGRIRHGALRKSDKPGEGEVPEAKGNAENRALCTVNAT